MGINLNVHHCSRLTSSHICHQIGSVNLSPTLNNCQSAFTNDQLIAFSCNAHAHPGDPDQPELQQRSVNDWVCRLCRAPIRVEITDKQEIIAIALGQDDGVYWDAGEDEESLLLAQSEVKRIAAFEFYFLDRVPTDSWELGEQYAGLHAYTLIKQLSREYARELGFDDITEEALPMMALGSDKPSSQETQVKFKRTACHCC